MLEQNSFAWFASQFAAVWHATRRGDGIAFCRMWPELVLVTSTGRCCRSQIKVGPTFFERRSYYEYDGPDKHPRTYHVSRGRSAGRSRANRIINEDIKSNDRQCEEGRHADHEPHNDNTWQIWKNRVRKVFAKSTHLAARFWRAATRLIALLHDQSIWVFQQRRIQNAIGHEAQCAVLSQRRVLIVNQGDVVTGDSVLLALKSHALSDLLYSVERGKQKVTHSRQTTRQAEYRLDRWWPPYI